MFILVRLLHGFKEPLLYEVPPVWNNSIAKGTFVKVPLRNKPVLAYVEQLIDHKPATTFAIKQALSIEQIPHDPHYSQFITQLAYYHQTEPLYFIKRIRHFLTEKQNDAHAPYIPDTNVNTITLTDEQESVVSFLTNALHHATYTPTLLHGVTGSGKTEVYKKLFEQTIQIKKTALFLLPEVTLAVQFMHILKNQLGNNFPLVSFHSATSAQEKKYVWNALHNQHPLIIIGVHLPLLLPLSNLGLIIVDEEHDIGYQEKKHPKINSKEAALWRAQIAQIPILLGSATPSIASLYNVTHKKWHFFQLKKRFSGIFPSIRTVQLTDKKQRKNFWISTQLEQAIKRQLEKKEQTIIFLNRRGFSFFVQCKQCSFIFYCPSCSVSLTLHEHHNLRCHYCNYAAHLSSTCPQCTSSEFLKKGVGTQQIVHIMQKLFPTARIARADLDVTINKKIWTKTIQAFQEQSIDILVGTQTITKGYHFPKVTLIGVLWADLNLHFPIYNAAEVTLQQLIQVAGRAGRTGLPSNVIIQTMAPHTVFSYTNELDYLQFYNTELENRRCVEYPPCIRLVEIELKNQEECAIDREAKMFSTELATAITRIKRPLRMLGPTKPPLSKIKNWHIRKLYLKGSDILDIIAIFASVDKKNYTSIISFTPNPLS